MSQYEIDLIVSLPTSLVAVPVHDSVKEYCDCGREVWLDPQAQEYAAAGATIICFPCWSKDHLLITGKERIVH